jgi:tetratricopeptide (TPR) repeat protein
MQNEVRRLTDGELLYQRGAPPRSVFVFKHALMQDAAYSSLLRRTRMNYHARVADVLVAHFPETPDEVVAHHLTEASRAAEAVAGWTAAARRALGSFALAETLAHLHRGLRLVGQIEDPARRIEAELALRVLLNVPLMLTQGFAAPDVEANGTRMLELCEAAGTGAVEQQFPALWALWTFYEVSANYARAAEMGQRLSALADLTGDSGMRLAAHTAVGAAVLMRGQLDEARREFEAGLAVYDPARHAPLAMLFGQDAGAMCASFLAWVHSLDGAADQARARARQSLDLCDALKQPSTRGFVETVLATWCCLEGAFDQAVVHADAVIRLAAEQGMPHWDAQATITRGWALAGLGRGAEGIDTMQRSIQALLAIGSRASMTFYWAGLAEAQLSARDTAGAQRSLDQALAMVDRGDERIYEGGLRWLEGRIALAAGGADALTRAQAAFQSGLAVARAQGARRLVNQLERAIEAAHQLSRSAS